MKNSNLNAYGVGEMDLAEMRETEGGSMIGKILKFIGEALAGYTNGPD